MITLDCKALSGSDVRAPASVQLDSSRSCLHLRTAAVWQLPCTQLDKSSQVKFILADAIAYLLCNYSVIVGAKSAGMSPLTLSAARVGEAARRR